MKNGLWQPNPYAKEADIRAFGDIMYQLDNHVASVMSAAPDHRKFRTEAITASVALRKLLKDNLLERSLRRPRFHKLAKHHDNNPLILSTEKEITCKTTPASENLRTTKLTYQIEIHSLPGWEHSKISTWKTSEAIFHTNREPMLKLDEWLKQPLFKVETEQGTNTFSLGDTLSYVANTEGAHTDNYQPRNERISKEKYAQCMEAIGGPGKFTYPHWVIIYIATYLRNRQAHGLVQEPEEWMKYIEKDIVTPLEGYAYLNGEISSLSWRIAVRPIRGNIDTLDQPPPEYQNHRWIITSAVE